MIFFFIHRYLSNLYRDNARTQVFWLLSFLLYNFSLKINAWKSQFTFKNRFLSVSAPLTSFIFFRKRFYLFSERGRDGEREGEKHRCGRDTWRLPSTCSQQGTWPAAQACALTRNRSGLQASAQSLHPLRHTGQGHAYSQYKLTHIRMVEWR